ncbi:hypothetical protein [Reyranella sp.]|uniref:hypothetical protein n=1 Tax=Reyranella sp. TaxID=1929291 RepID=UPI00403573B0
MENLTREATARRNLAQRMERFLVTVGERDKPLGPWETDLLCQVLVHLGQGSFWLGEDVMLRVERPDLYRTYADVADGPTLTVAGVRAKLAKVLAGK